MCAVSVDVEDCQSDDMVSAADAPPVPVVRRGSVDSTRSRAAPSRGSSRLRFEATEIVANFDSIDGVQYAEQLQATLDGLYSQEQELAQVQSPRASVCCVQ